VLESVSTEAAVADAKKLGFALWLEESKTSHFLQMPDRITRKCHAVYKKACKNYKELHEFTYGESCTIGVCEFLEIWGGCREMNYEGAWFSWCSTQTVLAAWRAVGFFQGGLDPTQIDRSNFYDRQPEPDPEPEPEESEPPEVKTPAGLRSGSLKAVQAKLEQSLARTAYFERKLEEANQFDPKRVPGLMAPRVPTKVKKVRSATRIDESQGGDISLRGLGCKAGQKRQAAEEEQARLEAVREDRAAKKLKLTQEKEALEQAFEHCLARRDSEGKCKCKRRGGECDMAKFIRCPRCGDIKRGVCRKPACRQQLLLTDESGGQPLLLTHNGA
jgi:hypothetical protein